MDYAKLQNGSDIRGVAPAAIVTGSFMDTYAAILEDKIRAANQEGWSAAPSNYEGIRVNLDDAHGNGWFLPRLSLHDPLLPLNKEKPRPTGRGFLQMYDCRFMPHCWDDDLCQIFCQQP